jgi:hypothetical protein
MDVFKVSLYINRMKQLIPRVRQALKEKSIKEKDEVNEIAAIRKDNNLLDFTTNFYSNQNPPSDLITPSQLENGGILSPVMDGQATIWDFYVPEDSSWARKSSNAPWATRNPGNSNNGPIRPAGGRNITNSAAKLQEYKEKRKKLFGTFNNRRLTGKVKIRKSSIENLDKLDKQVQLNEPKGPSCGSQFKEYCAATSLHGYRYIAEKKRNPAERYEILTLQKIKKNIKFRISHVCLLFFVQNILVWMVPLRSSCSSLHDVQNLDKMGEKSHSYICSHHQLPSF